MLGAQALMPDMPVAILRYYAYPGRGRHQRQMEFTFRQKSGYEFSLATKCIFEFYVGGSVVEPHEKSSLGDRSSPQRSASTDL
jgi:hypothetical protein